MVHLGEVSPAVVDFITERIETAQGNFDYEEDLPEFDWRKSANSRKFDRQLFEKYGYLKDLILHPKFQFVKNYLEENADFNFDLQVGEPLLPITTMVIILFMLHKRVSNTVVGLVALFLFNVNPLYVCMSAFVLYCLNSGTFQPRQFKSVSVASVKTITTSITGSITSTASTSTKHTSPSVLTAEALHSLNTTFDHVLIGSDISTLYAAALMAKNGHTCCVLQPKELGNLYEIYPAGAPCAAPVTNLSIGRIEKYQGLLDAATTGASGRVNFSPVGTAADGYTSAIVHSVYQSGNSKQLGGKGKEKSTFTNLRAGESSLAHDLCLTLPVDRATLTATLHYLLAPLTSLTSYLVNKCIYGGGGSSGSGGGGLDFSKLSTFTVDEILSGRGLKCPETEAALSAIATVGTGESLASSVCSAAMLSSSVYTSSSGVFYPNSGADGVVSGLVNTIQCYGGVVYSGVSIGEVVLEECSGGSKVKATGVTVIVHNTSNSTTHTTPIIADTTSTTNTTDTTEVTFTSNSVISGTGILHTYTKLVPPEAITLPTKHLLSNTVEALPKARIVYWIQGSQENLGISSTDYYEVGAQPSLFKSNIGSVGSVGSSVVGSVNSTDSSNTTTSTSTTTTTTTTSIPTTSPTVPLTAAQLVHNESEHARFAQQAVHVWSPSCKESTWTDRHGDNLHIVVVELALPTSALALGSVAFDSDNSDTGSGTASVENSAYVPPRVYYSTHPEDAHTHPASTEYATHLASSITMSKSRQDKLRGRADSVLRALYPAAASSVVYSHVHLPVLTGGGVMSNSADKFSAPLSAVTDVQNLYLTGRDLGTVGLAAELQGGWACANAVLGYTHGELVANRNIIADLNNVKK